MATQTETLTIATLSGNADGRSVSAEVRKEGRRYVIVVDQQPVESTAEIRAAYQAMARAVRGRLPRGEPASWGVEFRCTTGGFGLVYGNRAGGGGSGGGQLNPCVQAAVNRYHENTLHHALEHAASTLARCCK